MEEEELGSMRTFKLQRSQSCMNWLGCRWKSSTLLQDSLSQHDGAFVPMPGYERLSQSMRFFSEERRREKLAQRLRLRLRQGGWVRKVMGHVFFLHKVDVERGERKEGEERKKKRSSWLPDPERRWPVQGW